MDIELLKAEYRKAQDLYSSLTGGYMGLDIHAFQRQPDFDDVVAFFRKEGFTESELADICYVKIGLSDLTSKFREFFAPTQLTPNLFDVDQLAKSVFTLSDGLVVLLHFEDEGDICFLALLCKLGEDYKILDFWWQLD